MASPTGEREPKLEFRIGVDLGPEPENRLQGSSRIRKLRNSIGLPSASRHR